MPLLTAQLKEMLAEQFQYRDLLFQMTRRDLLLRYKQTVMGFGWAVFMPLLNTAVFSVIFTRVTTLDAIIPIPYPVFAFCGLWIWNFFSGSLRFSVTSLTSNTNLVNKVYFPREIFPFSAVLVCLVDFAVGSVVMGALMAWYQLPLSPQIVWLPLIVLVLVLFTTAVSLVLAMGNLFYRDVKYLFEIVIAVWMFASSVLYPMERLGGVAGSIVKLNPLTPIIDAFRGALLLNTAPSASFWVSAAIAVAVFSASWLLFHRLEFTFAENI